MSLPTDPRHPRRRGAILVLVLGLSMLLSWVAIEILDSVRKELARHTSPPQEERLRAAAYQLLEVSIAALAQVRMFESEFYSPLQGWSHPLLYAGMADTMVLASAAQTLSEREEAANAEDGEEEDSLLAELLEDQNGNGTGPAEDGDPSWNENAAWADQIGPAGNAGIDRVPLELPDGLEARVRIRDESGKLSLTETSEERWKYFFEALEFEESDANRLTDSLLDWMDADDEERPYGAETETYSQREPPYVAPNRPLRDFRELRKIAAFEDLFFEENGTPNEFMERFRDSVSFLNQETDINYNTANEWVIEALGEELGFEPDTLLDYRSGDDAVPGTGDDRMLRPEIPPEDLPKDEEGEPLPADRTVRHVTVDIQVSDGQYVYTLQALLDLDQEDPGGVYPFRILRVFENLPAASLHTIALP